MIVAKITFTGLGVYDAAILENLDELCDILNKTFGKSVSFDIQNEYSIITTCEDISIAEDIVKMVMSHYDPSKNNEIFSFMRKAGIKFSSVLFTNYED